MQDIHSIPGGRIFGAAAAASSAVGDRRLRPHGHHGHHHQHGHHPNHQALKCPRCDSLNTKFCYYNNYNLSQPRHFCKSCRRYWTKGGVLRNVPVGGGCRKSKRSSKPKSSPAAAAPADPPPAAAAAAAEDPPKEPKTSSHSSSESSSLTATTTAVATEAVSAPSSASHQSSLLNISDYKSMMSQGMNANPSDAGYEHPGSAEGGLGLFSDIGSFTSLITSSSDGPLSYGFSAVMAQQNQDHQAQQNQWHQIAAGPGDEMKMPELGGGGGGGGFLDQNVLVDLPTSTTQGNRPGGGGGGGGGGFGALDWQPGADQGLFDLPNAVDHAYWSQSQWSTDGDQDPTGLYLP
ncbi:hypothetical protein ACJRO7_009833 [Eucalyptus globulus]|uniref:Dof zinc finger protein n=1 Tax=Eucalyptus globulus TaxID=34317 RepID=A0ABD3LA48_EUCGL